MLSYRKVISVGLVSKTSFYIIKKDCSTKRTIFLLIYTRLFVTLRRKSRTYSVSAKKRMIFFCFALDFS